MPTWIEAIEYLVDQVIMLMDRAERARLESKPDLAKEYRDEAEVCKKAALILRRQWEHQQGYPQR